MRWKNICLPAVLLAMLAVSVQAVEKADKPAPEKGKAFNGQVTAISVSGDSISLTVKTREAEKSLTMANSVNVLTREAEGKTIIMGMHVAGEKTEKPKNDAVKLVTGKVTAASIDGELLKLTVATDNGTVEGQMGVKVNVALDKDGNAIAVRSGGRGGDMPKAPKEGGDKPGKEKKEKKE